MLDLLQRHEFFRSVNRRVLELADSFAATPARAEFLCECADIACVERLEVGIEDFVRFAAQGARYVVVPGHEDPARHQAVEEVDGALVIEIRG